MSEPREVPADEIADQLAIHGFVQRELDGAFRRAVPREAIGERVDRLGPRVQPDVMLERGEVDEVLPLPERGHAPGYLLDGIRGGGANRGADLVNTYRQPLSSWTHPG